MLPSTSGDYKTITINIEEASGGSLKDHSEYLQGIIENFHLSSSLVSVCSDGPANVKRSALNFMNTDYPAFTGQTHCFAHILNLIIRYLSATIEKAADQLDGQPHILKQKDIEILWTTKFDQVKFFTEKYQSMFDFFKQCEDNDKADLHSPMMKTILRGGGG